jgi:transcription-repair coupling factor (superfamily II helicase)
MNLEVLMKKYADDHRIFSIADKIVLSQPSHLHLSGLTGSASQFVLAAVFNHPVTSQLNHLVILKDAEEAAYFHNTVENITSALNLFYFPSSFKTKKNFSQLNSSHVMLRTETLTKLSRGGNKKILITYPEAIFEKVVFSEKLNENIISFKTGENINPDLLFERFVNYGFTRSDFVYEPGQFAVRGGILDIYSFGNEKPYRLELFGNEIESIRIFDPETQLSERRISQVNIIPNVDTQFSSGEKTSLFNFMPENTIVWTENWEFIKEKIEEQEEDVEGYLALGLADHPATTEPDTSDRILISKDDFASAKGLEKEVAAGHIVEFGSKSYFYKNKVAGVNSQQLEFATNPQPAFNRQFTFLIENLTKLEAGGYAVFIFAENPKQLERLHSIFTVLAYFVQAGNIYIQQVFVFV